MANRGIEEKLFLFEQNLDAIRLLLNDGSRYQGIIEKDPFRGTWQIRTSQASFPGNLRQDAIQFKVEDVAEVEPLDYILTSARRLNVPQILCMQQDEKPKKYKAVRLWLQDGSRALGMWTGDRWWSTKGEINPARWELEERKEKRTKELLKSMKREGITK